MTENIVPYVQCMQVSIQHIMQQRRAANCILIVSYLFDLRVPPTSSQRVSSSAASGVYRRQHLAHCSARCATRPLFGHVQSRERRRQRTAPRPGNLRMNPYSQPPPDPCGLSPADGTRLVYVRLTRQLTRKRAIVYGCNTKYLSLSM